MPLTFQQLKDEIISRTKQLEICDTLHDAQNAATEDELIKAGLPLIVYSYQSGIVDDTLLAEFTEATLNANGIYTIGSFTLTDPADEVYIMKTADVTINLTGSTNCKINAMGGGILTLVASDTSYATVKAYDAADLDITINDEAMVNLETREDVTAQIIQNDASVFHLTAHGNSDILHVGNDNAYGLAKMFQHSVLTSVANPSSIMVATTYNSSQVFLT